MKAQRGSRCRYSSPLSLTLVPEGGGSYCHTQTTSPPRKKPSTHCPGGWVKPQGKSGYVWKILTHHSQKPQTVQPAVCHYTDYTIPAFQYLRNLNNNWNV